MKTILQQSFALICACAGEIVGFEVNRVDKIVSCFEKKSDERISGNISLATK